MTFPSIRSEAEFRVTYEGSALESHSIPVRDLAPALIALGQAFDRANGILNGSAAAMSLEIRAFQPGSFDVALVLKQIYDSGTSLFSGDLISSAANLKELFFSPGGAVGAVGLSSGGVITLVKRLRGRAIPTPEQASPEAVRLRIDNLDLTIPSSVYSLANDAIIREQLEAVVRPVLSPGIDRVVFRDDNTILETVSEEEVDYFEASATNSVNGLTTETVLPSQMLRAETANFGTNGKWRLNDGDKTRWYTISDEDFIRSVDTGHRSFRKGDVFVCEVVQRQTRDTRGYLQMHYEIRRVLQHLPPQSTLMDLLDNTGTS
ncbi:MAG: hypothetical protein IT303_14155 [Dehalococcoidia bacterium]|nr:hypothetical protein [Dehalococcoidia bacterium]